MPLGLWFWRGFQSAIFYYVSCAPCTKVAYRRRRRKESQRAKAEKALAGPYAHPLPSSTNPYWREEMALGPGPPPRRGAREKEKKDQSSGGRKLASSGVGSSTGTGTSSDDIRIPQEVDDSGEGWNTKRYQREDETLWGRDSEDEPVGMSLSRPGSGAGNYYYARNPAVNDLHPPVVSTQPTCKSEIQWMLQPPPRAKVMEGKEPANRSRSASGTSNGSRSSSKRPATESSLGRQLMESRLSKGDHASLAPSSAAMSRGPSNRSLASASSRSMILPDGQRHDRDTPHQSVEAVQRSDSQTRNPPPAPLNLTADGLLSPPQPARPPLSTIPSSSLPQNRSKPPRSSGPQATASVSSHYILQELISQPNATTSSPNLTRTNNEEMNNNPNLLGTRVDDPKSTAFPPVDSEEEYLSSPEFESRWPSHGGWGFDGSRLAGADAPHGSPTSFDGDSVGIRGRWSMDI